MLYLSMAWCAINDATLQDNLSKMQWVLTIDGQPYAGNLAIQNDWPKGAVCQLAGGVIQGWQSGRTYVVDFGYTFTQELNDGRRTYPAGQYLSRFTVHVP